MPTYPGGKNGSGVYQAIINRIPPHKAYVELFLGGGAIMRHKKLAADNYGIDLNPAVIAEWRREPTNIHPLLLFSMDAFDWMQHNYSVLCRPDTFLYLDPPYLMETRSSQRQLYLHEMGSEVEHKRLLEIILDLKCMVMISGYSSPLYFAMLCDWSTHHFTTRTRGGGIATEWLWMNYPPPLELHDYRYLGENYREREVIQRRQKRWAARLRRMTLPERQAMLAAIDEIKEAV